MFPSDNHLLLACQGGDETAWETLVHRYQHLIYAIPRRAGLDETQSADVFQEVFTTLFEKLHDIEEPDRLHAWLVTTARRKTSRFLAKARAGQRHTASQDIEDETERELLSLTDNAPLPDQVLLRLEKQQRVRSALLELDDRCRKLLTMLFYTPEPPSYAEIAVALGTSEGSIGPTRARCLGKMLRLLEK
jgi:RNA polymerase sigma factor (sigma-70 family)